MNEVELLNKSVNYDLQILSVGGKDSKNYKLVECRCKCGYTNYYRKSEVLSGKRKRCSVCNVNQKRKYTICEECKQSVPNRDLSKSERFGLICKPCFHVKATTKCSRCDILVDTSVGNHSGLCAEHWNEYRVAYCLFASAKYRAKKLGLPFDLDVDWIRDRLKVCEVTGIEFYLRDVKIVESTNYTDRPPLSPSIDKINPNNGYTKGNCRVVCWWYNLAKSNWKDGDILNIVKQWVQNKGDKFGTIFETQ